tara:strand:- start:570 stop:1055 length:486 start_codon:yes stop_codon:yes gene_type:complete
MNYIEENFKEMAPDQKFMATEKHEVIEYGVPVFDYPTIDSVRSTLGKYIEEFKHTERMQEWVKRTVGRRILFCPTHKCWHVIVIMEKRGLNAAQLGSYFDWSNEVGFKSAFRIRSTQGNFYNELQAEADGCIKVLEQNFNEVEWEHYNMEVVSNLLSKITH